MREEGKVAAIQGETALIRLQPKTLAGCAGCRICAKGPNDERTVEVPNPHGVKPGDCVTVEVPLQSRYVGVLLFFVLPLVLLGAFGAAGHYLGMALFETETAANVGTLLMGAMSLGVSFCCVRLIDRLVIRKKTASMIVLFPGADAERINPHQGNA